MLQQQNWMKALSRAADIRTPEDVRALFSLSVAKRRVRGEERVTSGQELAGSGALVFEGETLDSGRKH